MFNWLKNFNKPELTAEDVGSTWWFVGTERDPFDKPEDETPVEILEVKDGWVRFYMCSMFPDRRMKISLFTALHRKIK